MKKAILFTIVAGGMISLTGCNGGSGFGSNAIIAPYDTPYQIPPFEKISMSDYEPAAKAGIEQHNAQIDSIIHNPEAPNFDNTIFALDMSGEILNKVQILVDALSGSDNTPEMQKLDEKLRPMFTEHNDKIMLNDSLFQRVKAVYDNADALGLDQAQKRLTEKYYRDFVRSGALLNPEQKDTLMKINTRLASLSQKFSANVMHDMSDRIIFVEDSAELSGLPQATKDAAAELAKEKDKKGQWAFTATGATRLAVLSYADSRNLRKQMYELYLSTANHGDEYDNSPIINEILQLRQQKAKLLGFNTFADYATDNVMSKKVENAENLLMQLWRPAIKKVDEEVADMQAYANAHGDTAKLAGYDYYYYAEKVKKEKFNFSEDDVRPYFVLDSVVKNGIFFIANKLYGLTFTEMPDAPKYNKQVKFTTSKTRTDNTWLCL